MIRSTRCRPRRRLIPSPSRRRPSRTRTINARSPRRMEESEGGEIIEVQRPAPAKLEKSEPLERTDDPVGMYLRTMRSIELLSRAGEIAIAKRIQAGREAMIAGLCASPLTFQAIIIWH